ncbi:sulfotransferase 1B1-like [Ylistrum balloti]|uniref:sulfotransferase 1B1-like n=1 Tax=Ylistrum balloti TaxID=509963 RepID=UPI002905F357|nr:sulfotransferase 1B1-like [Ylistrum balloti]
MEVVGVTLGDVTVEHKLFDGVNFPILCPGNVSDHLEKIRKLKYKESDVFIMSYPRSGTHWVREIVAMLLKGKAEYIVNDNIDFPLELLDIDTIEREASPRIFYSHMPFRFLPQDHIERNGKVIGCFRNPKDVITSSFHFLNNLITSNLNWDAFCDAALNGNVTYGSWFDWRDNWKTTLKQHAENPPLTVTYEDTSKDLRKQIGRIADYLEVTYTEALINDIAHMCEFKNMKAAKSRQKSDMMKRIDDGIHQLDGVELDNINENIVQNSVVRKGIVGDWKSIFTSDQIEKFNAMYRHRSIPDHQLEFKEYLED